MFPKGPRFEPAKVSDVPGPNAYDVNAESQLEDYKRGAFLDKADRFPEERSSQVPGPDAYEQRKPPKPASKPQQSLSDRYSVLQRKVEDLERVHNDSKKSYQTEVDRLKTELARSQKTNAEQADKLHKQKKNIDLLDARIQDFKKASTVDQAEIKDLRTKLRSSEHERIQVTAKQGEVGDLRKSLQSLETKRREELKERDKRISDLEKSLATEKKYIQSTESRLNQAEDKRKEEIQAALKATQKLETLVDHSQGRTRNVENALNLLKEEAADKENVHLVQLTSYKDLIRRVAEEYGHLAASTVPIESHKRIQHQYTVSQIHVLRLERKLANSEGQVVELAHLIRQMKEQNVVLVDALRDMEHEILFHVDALQSVTSALVRSPNHEACLLELLYSTGSDLATFQEESHVINTRFLTSAWELDHLTYSNLLSEYTAAEKLLREEQLISQQHATSLADTLASHKAIAARLETVESERQAAEGQLRAATELADTLRISTDSMVRKVKDMEEKMEEVVASSKVAVKKEKDIVQRLNMVVQKSRMAEDALRAEIEGLTSDLVDAARYQEAYGLLSEEVGALVARHQLAEEEAQRLSKFNVEILSHNNPAQRIVYVDRIRKELAETKHKLIMLTREQEAALAANEDLQHELDMYKSVMVPVDQKPRTNMIRVTRPPLVDLVHSLNVDGGDGGIGKPRTAAQVNVGVEKIRTPVLETIPGDMTIDEIS